MGRPKQLLPLPGGTVLSTVVSRLLEAPLDRVVVVLGHEAEKIQREAGLPSDPRVDVALNEHWREGMASSLRCGLAACAAEDAVVIALGDQPGIEPRVVEQLVTAFRHGAAVAVPVAGERPGHPVLFARPLWEELGALRGDVGAREVLVRHWKSAVRVPATPLQDLDTEMDYRALAETRPSPSSARSPGQGPDPPEE
jgi:CTP:molybdopterin cytidylyltransferase MocA